jgi:hypothetical protein
MSANPEVYDVNDCGSLPAEMYLSHKTKFPVPDLFKTK